MPIRPHRRVQVLADPLARSIFQIQRCRKSCWSSRKWASQEIRLKSIKASS